MDGIEMFSRVPQGARRKRFVRDRFDLRGRNREISDEGTQRPSPFTSSATFVTLERRARETAGSSRTHHANRAGAGGRAA